VFLFSFIVNTAIAAATITYDYRQPLPQQVSASQTNDGLEGNIFIFLCKGRVNAFSRNMVLGDLEIIGEEAPLRDTDYTPSSWTEDSRELFRAKAHEMGSHLRWSHLIILNDLRCK